MTNAVRDVPIIYSAPMVRALIREAEHPGTGKTMTRRLAWRDCLGERARERLPSPWQKVKPGDRLWVRESFFANTSNIAADPVSERPISYKADHPGDPRSLGWKPSIHMPRWASRLTLIVTATKIERLQDISEEDARAEGLIQLPATGRWVFAPGAQYAGLAFPTARECFKALWFVLHGPESWDANPEVVAVSFQDHVHQVNIDRLALATPEPSP